MTNSRDAQEVEPGQGAMVLSVFRDFAGGSSLLLDDRSRAFYSMGGGYHTSRTAGKARASAMGAGGRRPPLHSYPSAMVPRRELTTTPTTTPTTTRRGSTGFQTTEEASWVPLRAAAGAYHPLLGSPHRGGRRAVSARAPSRRTRLPRTVPSRRSLSLVGSSRTRRRGVDDEASRDDANANARTHARRAGDTHSRAHRDATRRRECGIRNLDGCASKHF